MVKHSRVGPAQMSETGFQVMAAAGEVRDNRGTRQATRTLCKQLAQRSHTLTSHAARGQEIRRRPVRQITFRDDREDGRARSIREPSRFFLGQGMAGFETEKNKIGRVGLLSPK